MYIKIITEEKAFFGIVSIYIVPHARLTCYLQAKQITACISPTLNIGEILPRLVLARKLLSVLEMFLLTPDTVHKTSSYGQEDMF